MTGAELDDAEARMHAEDMRSIRRMMTAGLATGAFLAFLATASLVYFGRRQEPASPAPWQHCMAPQTTRDTVVIRQQADGRLAFRCRSFFDDRGITTQESK